MINPIKKNKKKIKSKLEIKKTAPFLFLGVFILVFSFYLTEKTTGNNEEKETKTEEIKLSESLLPIRKWEIDAPSIDARSGVVAYIDSENNKKFVFEKNKDLKVPIASITKLMTALIVLENYDLDETITISEEIFGSNFSRNNNFFPKEEYRVKDLLYSLLMESDNTVSRILAQKINFIELMNEKALNLGMTNTYFINPSGLDPLDVSQVANYSTAKDLTILVEVILEKPLIIEILSTSEYNLIRQDGFFKHTIINTNELLSEMPEIIMGKTGTTSRAGQCLVLAVSKNNKGYLISVILGSKDRFKETKKIINWANKAYYWEINKW